MWRVTYLVLVVYVICERAVRWVGMTVHTDSENGLAQDRRQPIFRTNADTQSCSSTFRIIPFVKIRLSYNDSDDYMCSTYILHAIIPFQELKVALWPDVVSRVTLIPEHNRRVMGKYLTGKIAGDIIPSLTSGNRDQCHATHINL